MKTAQQYAATARDLAVGRHIPPNVRLNRVLDLVEKVNLYRCGTKPEKQKALAVCWDVYARIVADLDPTVDESWGNAKQGKSSFEPDLPMISDERVAQLVMYGQFDDDGTR